MKLDDLVHIDGAARSAESTAKTLRYHASVLARVRTNESGDGMIAKVITGIGDGWGKFDDTPRAMVRQVLAEQLGDILRIAELRLEARARAASAKHRLLIEQVRSFFDEEAQP
jgi:hypothetical protein